MPEPDAQQLTDVRALRGRASSPRSSWRGLPDRHVGAVADAASLLAALGGPVPETGVDAVTVIEELARAADPGLVATAGPRFFGFVIGGSVPAARAADSLVGTWDQNAALFVSSPAAAVVGGGRRGLGARPPGPARTASVGFVTGCQMANFTCLAAARHSVLERVGWDVERDGLIGAPTINVVVSAESHATILAALRLVGLGSGRAHPGADRRPGPDARPTRCAAVLASLEGPTIVCAQAGNVDTGCVR